MAELIKFEYVNENGDFAAMLTHYNEEFTQKGTSIRMLCPFHDENTPSLSITTVATGDAKANTFHCFGCHRKGTIIDYVAWMEETDDLREAARIVARVSGCALAPPRGRKRRERASSAEGNQVADNRVAQSRRDRPRRGNPTGGAQEGVSGAEGAPAGDLGGNPVNPPLRFAFTLDASHAYIAKRVDTPALVAQFGIGHLPETSRSMMAGRVLIPIENGDGEIIAYAGRWPSDEVPDGTEKYLLPAKFAKLSALFNIHRVVDTDYAVIVEGFFGAIRLHGLCVPTVALMGHTMSAAQVELLLARGIKRVLLMLDGDDAGKNATPALLDLLTRSFFVKVGLLPDGECPDTASVETLLNLAEPVEP